GLRARYYPGNPCWGSLAALPPPQVRDRAPGLPSRLLRLTWSPARAGPQSPRLYAVRRRRRWPQRSGPWLFLRPACVWSLRHASSSYALLMRLVETLTVASTYSGLWPYRVSEATGVSSFSAPGPGVSGRCGAGSARRPRLAGLIHGCSGTSAYRSRRRGGLDS